MTVESLIENLQALEALDGMAEYADRFITDHSDDHDFPQEGRKLVDAILHMTGGVLITATGSPNYAAMDVLKKAGYRVGPGETDNFGWLTGVIYTKCGKIVYG